MTLVFYPAREHIKNNFSAKMKLLVDHEMEHADAENDGMSDKISASSSSVAGWWVIYNDEM